MRASKQVYGIKLILFLVLCKYVSSELDPILGLLCCKGEGEWPRHYCTCLGPVGSTIGPHVGPIDPTIALGLYQVFTGACLQTALVLSVFYFCYFLTAFVLFQHQYYLIACNHSALAKICAKLLSKCSQVRLIFDSFL